MSYTILQGDALAVLMTLPSESAPACCTSPPYWGLRDYGVDGQIGLEPTPALFVQHLVEIFREVRRVLRRDGTCWINLGDSYAGSGEGGGGNRKGNEHGQHDGMVGKRPKVAGCLKPKDLIGIPWRVAFALQADGWWLRSDIIWHKPNPMPESVTDRPTKAHEYIFLLSKSAKYYYDAEAIAEPLGTMPNAQSRGPKDTPLERGPREAGNTGLHDTAMRMRNGDKTTRNKRSVWTIATYPVKDAHFATYPPDLIEPCILAGCPDGGMVLDPFTGSGTTGLAAIRHGRQFIGIELNPAYIEIAEKRLQEKFSLFARNCSVEVPRMPANIEVGAGGVVEIKYSTDRKPVENTVNGKDF